MVLADKIVLVYKSFPLAEFQPAQLCIPFFVNVPARIRRVERDLTVLMESYLGVEISHELLLKLLSD